ncbi:MAG: lytic transglycosylase domain-containing protein, partial [Anaerolineae bacterium]
RYLAYLDVDNTLRDLVYERLGDAYAGQGEDEAALEWYVQAVGAAPDLTREFTLLEKVAEAEGRLGRVKVARKRYESILSRSRYAPYRARISYKLAELLRQAGQEEEALRAYQATVDEDVRSHHAYLAMVRLVEAGAEVDEFQRGLADYHNGAYWPAVAAFRRVLEDTSHPRRDEARLYLARSFGRLELPAMAADWYRLVVRSSPQATWIGEAWLEWANALWKAGQAEQARQVLADFAKDHPDHPQRANALWQRATILDQTEGCQAAVPEYQALAKDMPESPFALRSLVQAGLCLYEAGEYREAEGRFRRAAALSQEQGQDNLLWQATFWAGKALLALGEEGEAREAWQPLVEAAGEAYYGLRAREILGEVIPFTGMAFGPSSPTGEGGEAEDVGVDPEVLEWIAGWSGQEIRPTSKLEEAFASDRRFLRAMAMLPVGLVQEAQAELEPLRSVFADDPQSLYALAVRLRREGLYRQSALAARTLISRSRITAFEETPLTLRQLVYPVAYRDLILQESRANGLDPALLAAIIRQESLFEVSAVSTAQARGLMQVIGPTGEWIALKLGWRNFREEMLYLPYVNVKFGAYYLKVQLEAFDGDLGRALVAYNAGPGRARQWGEGVSDGDLFVERIALDEPRQYLEQVYEGYQQYRQLYVEGLVARKR